MLEKLGVLIGVALLAGPVLAVNPGERREKPSDQQKAEIYAAEILDLTNRMAGEYAREIPQEVLLLAALKGLHEAARQTLPVGMEAQLKKATERRQQLAILVSARRNLGDNPALDGDKALFASLQALATVLDPHCMLVPASVFSGAVDGQDRLGIEFDGESPIWQVNSVQGLGTMVPKEIRSIPFRVAKIIPGGPAQRAGMRPGDVITHFNGKEITANSAQAISREILDAKEMTADQSDQFTVLREGRKKPFAIDVRKRSFEAESVFGVRRNESNDWVFWLDEPAGIAYVRFGAIDHRTPDQLAAALGSLGEIKGLLLDLRWCPGGLLNQAAEIAALFVDEGVVATVKYRNPTRQGANEFRAEAFGLQRTKFKNVPLMLLVNGETSGGGELIAVALKDNGRANVAGQRTVGKASVQTPIFLPSMNEYVFKLSVGTFVRPNGKNLQRFSNSKSEDDWGVRPDKGLEIPVSPDLGASWKKEHAIFALRPPESREALALDDPEADPQRFRAIRLLKQMIAAMAK